jgi:ankyrin repeat protein
VTRIIVLAAILVVVGCEQRDKVLPVPFEPKPTDCSRDLLAAIDRGDLETATDLRARGAVAACDETDAAMRRAVQERHLEAVKILVSLGATGCALNAAIGDARTNDLALLLQAGADPNAADCRPRPRFAGDRDPPEPPLPLQLAFTMHRIGRRGMESARLLLQHGADPNHRYEYRWGRYTVPSGRYSVELRDATPLIAASVLGDPAFVTLLLDAGADVNARDAAGKSALDYAREGTHDEIVALLRTKR